MAPTAPAPRRDLVNGLALLAGAVLVGAWLWLRPTDAPGRVAPPPVVLVEEDLPRAADGSASVRVRVVGPAVLQVEVTAPAATEVKVGPGRPVELEPRNLPDPAATTAFTHAGGTTTHEVRAFTTGMYVIHLAPTAAGPLRVRVTKADWRAGPSGG
ncbi:MAG: hypothetical protein JNM10_03970 [Planctomycetia bacterium]|nr:hypothetical protein [Planctomycetia bacterium]